MKKICRKLLCTMAIACIVQVLHAQIKNRETISVDDIYYTWKADSIFVNKIKKPSPAQSENSSVRFNKNHTTVNTDKGRIEKGTWTYDDKQQEIVITLNSDNAKITLTILSLNKTKMIAILKYPEVKDEIKMYLGH